MSRAFYGSSVQVSERIMNAKAAPLRRCEHNEVEHRSAVRMHKVLAPAPQQSPMAVPIDRTRSGTDGARQR
jgi:hypothetical protein